ncbi:MAG: hypothetical protein ABJA74_05615 [Lapillicoccus sp.]
MESSIPLLAGAVSTALFAGSALPMLRKAAVTKDLASYSLGNLLLANVGNLVHSLYVFSMPPGPIWALHAFYLISSALMLFWYVRFVRRVRRGVRKPAHPVAARMRGLPDAPAGTSFLA